MEIKQFIGIEGIVPVSHTQLPEYRSGWIMIYAASAAGKERTVLQCTAGLGVQIGIIRLQLL